MNGRLVGQVSQFKHGCGAKLTTARRPETHATVPTELNTGGNSSALLTIPVGHHEHTNSVIWSLCVLTQMPQSQQKLVASGKANKEIP